ncbi:MAG: hypothetical protein LBJ18_04740 [Rickettsiales bacterium]|jgi:hypothetical protein|nr:hypothetical protein [Rickettsiales bacterium]
MLSNITFYTGDEVWCGILGQLGAALAEPKIADVNFDAIMPNRAVSAAELKSLIIHAAEENKKNAIAKVFGKVPILPDLQLQIIARLSQSGGMTMDGLKSALGYNADTATHTVDTAIYNLRKTFGRDFIKNEKGIYCIDKLQADII